MSDVDRRLVAALREQLSRQPADAARIGWKRGGGDDERIGGEIAVGHITSSTTLENGATYRAAAMIFTLMWRSQSRLEPTARSAVMEWRSSSATSLTQGRPRRSS